MTLSARNYPSKVLLFGEYVIIRGARALAVPYPDFSGRWAWAAADKPSPELAGLLGYLEQLYDDGALLAEMDLHTFARELGKGLFFESGIPVGYGLGSSGAVVAAVYEAFCTAPEAGLPQLREQLAQIESFFHGASSGIDPLVCLLGEPLLLQGKEEAEVVSAQESRSGLFLLDTGMSRETAPLVRIFLKKCEDPAFSSRIESALLPASDAAIRAWLAGDQAGLLQAFEAISRFQWHDFQEMIPETFRPLWKKGLDSPHYKIKLCGAGGGGFLLGIAPDLETALRELGGHNIRLVYR
ncbi:MAG: mevalonate kinase [Saprospiraceae bacterium]